MPPASCTASIAVMAAASRSKPVSSFSIATGVGRSPRSFILAARTHLETVPVLDVLPEVRVGRVRLRGEVQQVERAAARAREVGRDGRDDAARCSGDDDDAVGTELDASPAASRGKGRAARPTPQRSPSA